jgi:hypothetical protein
MLGYFHMDQNVPYPLLIALSLIVIIWMFFWKGVALWRAAKLGQTKWFIFLVITILPGILYNTFGIIDITYLFFFSEKKLTAAEIKSWKSFFSKKNFTRKKKNESK